MAAIRGTHRDDTLIGTAAADRIVGLRGDDDLRGAGGNDVLLTGAGFNYGSGGTGDDALYGGAGTDRLFGDEDDDRLWGRDGRDDLYGGTGDDRLDGGGDDDLLIGDEGSDTLLGGAGDDWLYGQDGADRLTGGAGADRFVFQLSGQAFWSSSSTLAAMDRVTDFTSTPAERDSLFLEATGLVGDLAYNGATSARPVAGASLGFGGDGLVDVFVTQDRGAMWVLADLDDDGVLGPDDVVIRLDGAIDLTRADFSTNRGADGVASLGVRGTDGGDHLSAPDIEGSALFGLGGADTLAGGAGDDLIRGGDGRDLIVGGGGADELLGEAGHDRIFASGERVTMSGGDGNDLLDNRGSLGGELHGDSGDDVIRGFGGLYGDDGSDRIEVTAVDGRGAYVIAGHGDDVVNGGDGDDTIYGGAGNPADPTDTGRDLLRGGGGNDLLVGGAGDDRLYGGSGDDIIDGGDGDDLLSGQGGADTFYGGAGKDVLMMSRGGDVLHGNEGADRFVLSSTAFGGTIADLQISDRIDLSRIDADTSALGHQAFVFHGANTGNHGDDITGLQYYAFGGTTYLVADTDHDGRADLGIAIKGVLTVRPEQLLGISHAELVGTEGDDRLLGSAGDDVLSGLGGDDTLRGSAGDDRLRGGDGADSFVFGETFGRDVVTDFDPGLDMLKFDSALFDDAADVIAHARQYGADTLIADDHGNRLFLKHVDVDAIEAAQIGWI